MNTLGFHKVKVFSNKGYDVIIFVNNTTNEILSRDSNYIINAVMRLKFDDVSISIREVIITSIL